MLEQFLSSLMKMQQAVPFLSPVDPVALNIPDYFTIIKNPLDLGTIQKRLVSGKYDSDYAAFFSDLDLVWTNCQRYNPKSLLIHRHSKQLQKLCRQFELQYWGGSLPESRRAVQPSTIQSKPVSLKRSRTDSSMQSPRHSLPTGSSTDGTLREPTLDERQRFTRKIWRLVSSDPNEASRVINLIIDKHRDKTSCVTSNRVNPDRFMLNFDLIADDIFWETYHLC